MMRHSKGVPIWLLAMCLLSNLALTACVTTSTVVLPDSQVQKMSKGESALFDGYLLTPGAVAKLLETAEKCKAATECPIK